MKQRRAPARRPTATDVVTIDPGTDGTVQVGTDTGGVTVINTTATPASWSTRARMRPSP
jgi:hypothetical protein